MTPPRAADAAPPAHDFAWREPSPDRAAAVALIAAVRWAGVALGAMQAFLVTAPRPIGGPWFVLLASGVMAAYNVPATRARKLSPTAVDRLRWLCLVGDFLVCTAWTMLAANDIYSTTYAIYILVGIEAAYLYGAGGAAVFAPALAAAYAALYWERAAVFHFAVVISSVVFRAAIVLIAVAFSAAVTEQSQRRRADAVRARQDAERASRAKTEYLSRMSHELRTPLTAIIGFAELLHMRGEGEARETAASILQAGSHLLSLINDALDISRIESGKEQLTITSVELPPLLEDCLAIMRPLAGARDMTLSAGPVPRDAACVRADRQRLSQALLNLLSNAIKYAGAGTRVAITVRLREPDRVHISVDDDGPGIPADKAALAFEPFERLGAERTRADGSGLGLALTKRAVNAMGGDIGVDAREAGSSFWIELARSTEEVPRPAGSPADPRSSGQPPGDLVVLYAEDNLTTTDLVRRIVDFRPHVSLITTTEGARALDLARERVPDLILLDVHLPDMDGRDVLLALKADERTSAIPVVMMSADATRWQIDRSTAAGAAAYLTKPVTVAALLDLLDSLPASRTQLEASAG